MKEFYFEIRDITNISRILKNRIISRFLLGGFIFWERTPLATPAIKPQGSFCRRYFEEFVALTPVSGN